MKNAVAVLLMLLLSVTAHANPYTIEPPKGSADKVFNRDFVQAMVNSTTELINKVGHKVGLQPGQKVPLPTFRCLANTLAANAYEAGRRKLGINTPSEAELGYRAEQKKHCNDGDDGKKGEQIFKEAQKLFGQQHHNREALDEVGAFGLTGTTEGASRGQMSLAEFLRGIATIGAAGAVTESTAPALAPAAAGARGGVTLPLLGNPETYMPNRDKVKPGEVL